MTKKATRITDKEVFIAKILDLTKPEMAGVNIQEEWEVFDTMSHPNVVRTEQCYYSEGVKFVIVMELCPFGHL